MAFKYQHPVDRCGTQAEIRCTRKRNGSLRQDGVARPRVHKTRGHIARGHKETHIKRRKKDTIRYDEIKSHKNETGKS